jgi:hypothetical protein
VGRGVLYAVRAKGRAARIEEIFEAVFSIQSVPRRYTQDKSRIQLVGRQLPASKGVDTEAEEATVLKAVTRHSRLKRFIECSNEL